MKVSKEAEAAGRRAASTPSGLRVGAWVRTTGVTVHDEDGDLAHVEPAYAEGRIVKKTKDPEDGVVFIVRHSDGAELPWLAAELEEVEEPSIGEAVIQRLATVLGGVF